MKSLVIAAFLMLLALPVMANNYYDNPDVRPSLTVRGHWGDQDVSNAFRSANVDITGIDAAVVWPFTDDISILGGYDHTHTSWDRDLVWLSPLKSNSDVFSAGLRLFFK